MVETPPDDAAQEILTPQEIQHISDAFNFLYHGLKEAERRFENPASQDGGRDGAIHALKYVLKFFDVFHRTGIYPLIVSDGVHAPLVRLFDDLMSLDNGRVSAMLTPKKKSGRARVGGAYDGLKGIAVFTVRRLGATGLSLADARDATATALARSGIRPARKGSADGTGQFSVRTLRQWQDDVDFNVTATETFREAEAAHLQEVIAGFGLSGLPTGLTADDVLLQHFPAAELRRAYLDKLAAYIVRTRSQETT
jgi:hypothetical protein